MIAVSRSTVGVRDVLEIAGVTEYRFGIQRPAMPHVEPFRTPVDQALKLFCDRQRIVLERRAHRPALECDTTRQYAGRDKIAHENILR